jgi:hypothetical protein
VRRAARSGYVCGKPGGTFGPRHREAAMPCAPVWHRFPADPNRARPSPRAERSCPRSLRRCRRCHDEPHAAGVSMVGQARRRHERHRPARRTGRVRSHLPHPGGAPCRFRTRRRRCHSRRQEHGQLEAGQVRLPDGVPMVWAENLSEDDPKSISCRPLQSLDRACDSERLGSGSRLPDESVETGSRRVTGKRD